MPKRFPYAKGISTVCMVNEVGIPRIYQFLAIRVSRHGVENIRVYSISYELCDFIIFQN